MTHHAHGTDELCDAGVSLYEHALRGGRIGSGEAEAAPCLLEAGLLRPSPDGTDRLEPVAAAVALQNLLRGPAEHIADERRRAARLARSLAPLLGTGSGLTASAQGSAAVRVHSGIDRINEAVSLAMADASAESLTVQPHVSHTHSHPDLHARALERDQALLDRGGRIRALYQHTLRHAPTIHSRYEQLRGDVEARTLDEVTERLLVFDRSVAFIPASEDRTLALEIRHPAIVDHLATVFDRLWNLATPMYPEAVRKPSLDGVTPRRRAIAALLVEGHTDAVIADRLGMNVRTARLHIAKLAATLGSESRAQLGYLIGESGILKKEADNDGEEAAE
ncbi:helix-turn-helix transcriptional regulator [Streptomyces sp. NPDC020800]|uniref:helix-turn-helix transcriptional regulator n=1 Tax=Streptomyces sp. NPDC020800 TaxID=3365092 RepID=UPI0037948CD5